MPPTFTIIRSGTTSGRERRSAPSATAAPHPLVARANVVEDLRFTFDPQRRTLDEDNGGKRAARLRSVHVAVAQRPEHRPFRNLVTHGPPHMQPPVNRLGTSGRSLLIFLPTVAIPVVDRATDFGSGSLSEGRGAPFRRAGHEEPLRVARTEGRSRRLAPDRAGSDERNSFT